MVEAQGPTTLVLDRSILFAPGAGEVGPYPGACLNETLTKHYAYDTADTFATAEVASIVAALGPTGIKLIDNHNSVTGHVTTAGTYESLQGGLCGSDPGIELSGTTDIATLTYDLRLCLVDDSGPGTTHSFFTDLLDAWNGDPSITIANAIVAGPSVLNFIES